MRFRYIGLKEDGERAFQDKTGIEWFPGSEEDVENKDVCAEMLKHPTIWEPVGATTEGVRLAAAAKKQPVSSGPASDEDVDDQADAEERARKQAAAEGVASQNASGSAESNGDAGPLVGMDDAQVRAFAAEHGLKIMAIASYKGDKLRAKVLEALGQQK